MEVRPHSKFLLFSKYILQKLQFLNLMGRILSFVFPAQIDFKNLKLQGKGSQQKRKTKSLKKLQINAF